MNSVIRPPPKHTQWSSVAIGWIHPVDVLARVDGFGPAMTVEDQVQGLHETK